MAAGRVVHGRSRFAVGRLASPWQTPRDVSRDDPAARRSLAWIAPAWGVVGIVALLTQAVVRLAPRALEAVSGPLAPLQWAVLLAWVAFMAHAEGWRGFHQKFCPRVIARALSLREPVATWHAVLAPFYCLALVHATRRTKIVAWAVLIGITGLVVVVSRMEQPWRGIVDAGVVVGLAIGIVSLLWHGVRAMRGIAPPMDPGLP